MSTQPKPIKTHKSLTEALDHLLLEQLRLEKRGYLHYTVPFNRMSSAGFKTKMIVAAIGRMIESGEARYTTVTLADDGCTRACMYVVLNVGAL